MTYRTVGNQTSVGLRRSVLSQTLERQIDGVARAENSPNANASTDAGTAIIYKAHEHIPFGTAQYDENPI